MNIAEIIKENDKRVQFIGKMVEQFDKDKKMINNPEIVFGVPQKQIEAITKALDIVTDYYNNKQEKLVEEVEELKQLDTIIEE